MGRLMSDKDKYLRYREPEFLIIGAQKSGTTSLYQYMCQHPSIRPAGKKELHFFDKHYHQGIDWYRSFFPPVKLFKGIMTGEATPRYLFTPEAPKRVRHQFPGIKMIVLLRNPVYRTYSYYHHNIKRKLEHRSFMEAITASAQMPENDRDGFNYLAWGLYFQQLSHWRNYFPQEQFLIIKSEDFFNHPTHFMDQIFQFLGLENKGTTEFKQWNRGNYEPLLQEPRQWLTEYFKPHNQQLYQFLGRDMGWEQEGEQ
jgi:Sulfotransferase domain